MKRMLTLLVLALLAAKANPATIHVPVDQPTIQAGIDAAPDGDTVLVAPGQYNENVAVNHKGIFVLSSHGPEVTYLTTAPSKGEIIDRSKQQEASRRSRLGRVGTDSENLECVGFRYITATSAQLSGFTISYNEYPCTGAIKVVDCDSVTISNNIICHNFLSPGSMATIVYFGSSGGLVADNLIYDNHGHSAGVAAAPLPGQQVLVIGNTIDNCNVGIVSAVAPEDTASSWVQALNNCVTNNESFGMYGSFRGLDCNDVWNNTIQYYQCEAGLNDLSLDPMYCDAGHGDFNLSPSSPCVNLGGDCGDLIGARGVDPWNCYSFETTPIPVGIRVSPMNEDSTIASLNPLFSWRFFDTADGTSQQHYRLQVGTDDEWSLAEMWASGSIESPDSVVEYAGLPLEDRATYFFRLSIQNGQTWGDWRVGSFTIRLGYIVIHVPGDCSSVQEAIDITYSNDTVLVEPGTYHESINFKGKMILVKSTAGAHETVLTNCPESTLVRFTSGEDHSSVLEGFTLQGGWIGVLCENSGPTIRRTLLRDQCAYDWAAIALAGSGYPGSTQLGPSPAIIENCTIVNSANGGISSFSTAPPTIINTIVASAVGYGIHRHLQCPQLVLSYNDVFDCGNNYYNISSPGAGSINEDPGFTDVFSLRWESPCIDAGHPDSQYEDPDGTRNDMGAFCRLQDVDFPIAYDVNFGLDTLAGCIRTLTPEICWSYYDTTTLTQSAFQVQVGVDEDWGAAEKWDSGEIESADSCTVYAGEALADLSTYYMRMRVSNGCQWGQWCHRGFCTLAECCRGDRGNADYDASDAVNIVDLTYMVVHLFGNGPVPPCVSEADVNGDGKINIVDLTYLVSYLFGGGPSPAPCP